MIDHIKSHILSYGYPPTIRELMQYTGSNSTNFVWRALKKLEAEGLITVAPGQPRAIRLNGYDIVLIEKFDSRDIVIDFEFPEERYKKMWGIKDA